MKHQQIQNNSEHQITVSNKVTIVITRYRVAELRLHSETLLDCKIQLLGLLLLLLRDKLKQPLQKQKEASALCCPSSPQEGKGKRTSA